MSKELIVSSDTPSPRTALQAAVRGPLSNLLTLTIQAMIERGELVVIDGVITRPGQQYVIELSPLSVEADVGRE